MSHLQLIGHLTSTIITEFGQTSRILLPVRTLNLPVVRSVFTFARGYGVLRLWKGGGRVRVRIEVDEDLTEPEVVLRVPAETAATSELAATLATVGESADRLTLSYRGRQERVAVADILFCESAGHQVMVHTATQQLTTRIPLYKLAANLPGQFQRASKSAILNCNQVASLSKSLTGNLVRFQNSHKQLYVSRRYYGGLKQALERKG